MSYDPHYDSKRLCQLAGQHLAGSQIEGRLLFASESNNNQLDKMQWQMNDADSQALIASDFKLQLYELLGALLEYRTQHNQPNASQGVVNIRPNELSIEWLSKDEYETLYSA